MSAAIFGASLLEEVQEESLDHLLTDLRHILEPESKCLLGVPPLDRLLDVFRLPDSPAQQGHGTTELSGHDGHSERPGVDDHFDGITAASRPPPGLIELANAPSGTGRSSLLYHITAVSILPKQHGGKETAVVWLDTEASFSATRLYKTCIDYLTQMNDSTLASTKHTIAQDALKHVHVFSIPSSKHLINTLEILESYLLNQNSFTSNHHSMHRALSLIILDSATAFHWMDRFDTEVARLEAITTTSTQLPSSTIRPPTQTLPNQPQQFTPPPTATQILTSLKKLQSTFDCTVIYTTRHDLTQLNPPSSSSPRHHRHHQPLNTSHPIHHPPNSAPQTDTTPSFSPYTLNATLSLRLSRIPIPQFAPQMSLDECLRDRAKRQDVVSRNRVRVGVDEEWVRGVVRDKKVKERLRGLEGGARGAFVLRLDRDGGLRVEE